MEFPYSFATRPLVAFDIETETAGERYVYPNGTQSNEPVGLDPRVSHITALTAVDTEGGVLVLDGLSEQTIIKTFIYFLNEHHFSDSYRAPVFVGWNSLFFDLPFIKVRAGHHSIKTPISFVSLYSGSDRVPTVRPKYGYPEWVDRVVGRDAYGWDEAFIGRIAHLDIAPHFKQHAENVGVKFSLKPVAKSLGIEVVEVDPSAMHLLSPQERREYNLSDSQATLALAQILQREKSQS